MCIEVLEEAKLSHSFNPCQLSPTTADEGLAMFAYCPMCRVFQFDSHEYVEETHLLLTWT